MENERSLTKTNHRRYVPDRVVDFGRAVYSGGLGVSEVYEINAVLLAVNGLGQFALLTVVNDNLIVLAARYDVVAVGRKVEAIDFVGVLAEHLGHFEATHDVVYQLHLDHETFARTPKRNANRTRRRDSGDGRKTKINAPGE